MKKLGLLVLGIFLFTGCVKKEIIIKKQGFSAYEQKQNAKEEWKELDNTK